MQRHSIKAVLKTDKKNDKGHHPIYIRITINNKRSFVSTGYYVPKAMWDKRGECVKNSHLLYEDINTAIHNKKKELLNSLVNGSVKGHVYSAKELKQFTTTSHVRNNFFSFADYCIKLVKDKREPSTIENWLHHLGKLQAYHGSRELSLQEFTTDYLSAFEQHLRGDGHRDNYIVAILKTIRRIVNVAVRKGIIEKNPFLNYEMPDYTPGTKEHLTLEELDRMQQYYHAAGPRNHKAAIVYFLFGCYSGLRISDWYLFDRKKHLKDGYIRLRAKKNGEWIIVPIHSRLEEVLERMQEYKLTANPGNLTTLLNKLAKKAGIDKHITSHCARRTFAITLCLDRKIPSDTAADLMGISLPVFIESYRKVTPAKILSETMEAWKDL